MVMGPDNATVPQLRITTIFSGPTMFIVVLGSTFSIVEIPTCFVYMVLRCQLNTFTISLKGGLIRGTYTVHVLLPKY